MATQPLKLPSLKGKVIAIDGPAGAGKSTTARLLAERLGYTYLDTGAMYRAITWLALQGDIDLADEDKLGRLARGVPIEFKREDDQDKIYANGEDVTTVIRTPEVTRNVSQVAAHKKVREAMVVRQQEIAAVGSVVAEGRDTTTVVFPQADLKIYLDATVEERASRRLVDMVKMGVTTSLTEQEADIRRRDELDSQRKHSPLKKAGDAHLVDTTNMTIEEQVENIIALVRSLFKA